MKLKKLSVCVAAALALVVAGSAYVLGAGPLEGPPVPDLRGTWNIWTEAYLTPGGYESGSTIMVITEQTGSVFTGYTQKPDGTEEEINGVVLFRQVRLTDRDAVATGTFYDNNTIVGTFSNIATEPDISPLDEYGSGKFILQRVVE